MQHTVIINLLMHTFSANDEHSSRRLGRVRPTIHYDGNVTLDCPVILRTLCKVDMGHYPIDEQKCDLVFGSWAHNSDEIIVTSKVVNDFFVL